MATLYRGAVSHKRWHPKLHGFAYEVSMTLVDVNVSSGLSALRNLMRRLQRRVANAPKSEASKCLQRIDSLFQGWWPLASVNGSSLISFRECDHMKQWRKPGQSLADAVRDVVERHTGARPAGSANIRLLTHMAYFGYCFNPASFYYVYDNANTTVETVIVEVSNTPWNEMHLYVLHPSVTGVTCSVYTPQTSTPVPAAQDDGAGGNSSDADLRIAGAVPATAFDSLAAVFEQPTVFNDSDGAAADDAQLSAPGRPAPTASPSGRPRQRRQSINHALGTKGGGPSSAVGSGADTTGASTSSSSSSAAAALAAPGSAAAIPGRRLRYSWRKDFHVSPFMSINDQSYDWIFTEPGDTLLIQSQNIRDDGVRMFNTQTRLVRQGSELTFWQLAWAVCIAFPLLTWRLQWWIHYEAFRLWWKGVSLYPHPTG